jgi:hypothetical protein
VLLLLSLVYKLIYLLSSKLLRLAKILEVVLNISKGIAEYNKVISKRYIKFINIALVVKLLVSLICNLLIILKIRYSKLILSFKISFVIAKHVILLINNKDININIKEFILLINKIKVKINKN